MILSSISSRGFAHSAAQTPVPLVELKPGSRVTVSHFTPELSSDRRTQLQAYGLLPGQAIWIRQHKPVTVIQIDHTELALEAELARTICVHTA